MRYYTANCPRSGAWHPVLLLFAAGDRPNAPTLKLTPRFAFCEKCRSSIAAADLLDDSLWQSSLSACHGKRLLRASARLQWFSVDSSVCEEWLADMNGGGRGRIE